MWTELCTCVCNYCIRFQPSLSHLHNTLNTGHMKTTKVYSNILLCTCYTCCLTEECSSSILLSLSSIPCRAFNEPCRICQSVFCQVDMEHSEYRSNFQFWFHMVPKALIQPDRKGSPSIDILPFQRRLSKLFVPVYKRNLLQWDKPIDDRMTHCEKRMYLHSITNTSCLF